LRPGAPCVGIDKRSPRTDTLAAALRAARAGGEGLLPRSDPGQLRAERAVGGFTADHDPLNLVALAAFVRCCPRDGRNSVGVYGAPDLGPRRFKIACGTRNGTDSIATFYPVDEPATSAE
jgi:hypothetical protein